MTEFHLFPCFYLFFPFHTLISTRNQIKRITCYYNIKLQYMLMLLIPSTCRFIRPFMSSALIFDCAECKEITSFTFSGKRFKQKKQSSFLP